MSNAANKIDRQLVERCFETQVQMLIAGALPAAVSNLILILIVLENFHHATGVRGMVPWALAFIVVIGLRFGFSRLYWAKNSLMTLRQWALGYTAISCALGVLWSAAAYVFGSTGDLGDGLLLTVVIVTVATAGSTASMAYLPASAGFFLAVLIPMAPILFINAEVRLVFAALGVFYLVFFTHFLGVCNRWLVTSIRQTLANERQAQELTASVQAAELANKAQSDFLANVSHEIRTPMAGLLSMLQFVKESPESAESKQYIQIANDSAKTLLSLINDILDMSKIEGGQFTIKPRPCDLRAILAGPVALLERAALEKGLSLTVNCDFEGEYWLLIDGPRLRQVILNLVGNAIKFTEQGSVSVSVSCRGLAGQQREVSIRVSDTGIGIEADALETLFERFVQVDASQARTHTGTGLGLSISRGLLEVMDGELSATSKPGQGSEFTCLLSVSLADKPHKHSRTNPLTAPASEAKYHVLVVDDNPVNLMILEKLARGFGWSADAAASGARAIELFASSSHRYDAILMDIQMPKMDGIQATQRIRALNAKGRDIPVIAVTASSFNAEIRNLFERGFDGYVSKPIDKNVLQQEVLGVLERKVARQSALELTEDA